MTWGLLILLISVFCFSVDLPDFIIRKICQCSWQDGNRAGATVRVWAVPPGLPQYPTPSICCSLGPWLRRKRSEYLGPRPRAGRKAVPDTRTQQLLALRIQQLLYLLKTGSGGGLQGGEEAGLAGRLLGRAESASCRSHKQYLLEL